MLSMMRCSMPRFYNYSCDAVCCTLFESCGDSHPARSVCKIVLQRRAIVILRKTHTERLPAAVDTLWRCNRCHSPADSGGCTSARNAALVVAIHILQLLRRTLSSINACVYRLLLVAFARKHACAVASKLHSLVVTTTTTTRHDLATPDSGELPPPG